MSASGVQGCEAVRRIVPGRGLSGAHWAGSCAASGGKVEPGHIAKYHCLNSTSPNGFLTGADTMRSVAEEYNCFNPNGTKAAIPCSRFSSTWPI